MIAKTRGNTAEFVHQQLLDDLQRGTLLPGDKLTTEALARRYDVSRTPVREALILLEYQGLVRRLPNNHVRVAELSGDCLDHIFELVLALEAEVLEKWADPEELPDEELEFHRYLYEKCPFDFQRKMLETFTEIYLCFGIRARDHKLEKDPAGGLKAYLEEIKQAIIKERGKINAGVKTD